MNPLIVSTVFISIISLTFAQNLDQFGINGMVPGQASLYPFLSPPPPPPPPPSSSSAMMNGPSHGPGPHGPGHVHVPHPEGELFRQTPRYGGPAGPGGPGGPGGLGGIRGPPPPPLGPYATGLRLPTGFQYPIGIPPQPQFQFPPYPNPMGDQLLGQPTTTSTVECSCSVSFGIQNSSALVLPRTPQSLFPGVICGPGSVSLCRIQCMAQALNASFDLMNQAVNPINGNGISLQQFICGNKVNTTEVNSGTTSGTNSRMVNIKSETSCSEQSTDYSATNRRTESIALGPQECNTIADIGSFQLPSISSSAVPSSVN